MTSNTGATLVEAPEATEHASRWRIPLSTIAALVVVLAFVVTRPEVQHAARIGLGIAGFVPLATTLRGTVTDDAGAPVPHADIFIDQTARVTFSNSDRLGAYALAFDVMASAPTVVSIGATGYETRVREIQIRSSEVAYDARLHPLIRIDSGAELHLTVASDDSLCYAPERVWPCRTVHLTALRGGTLHVNVVTDRLQAHLAVRMSAPARVFLGTPAMSSGCCEQEAELQVPQGTEVTVDVLYLDYENVTQPGSSVREGFTLRSSD